MYSLYPNFPSYSLPDFLSHLFADPCAIKNCGTGFTCNGGICYCGTTICSSATANVCDAGTCKCGASTLCPQTGVEDQQCLSTTGAVPAIGDTTATCKVKVRRFRKYSRSKISLCSVKTNKSLLFSNVSVYWIRHIQ